MKHFWFFLFIGFQLSFARGHNTKCPQLLREAADNFTKEEALSIVASFNNSTAPTFFLVKVNSNNSDTLIDVCIDSRHFYHEILESSNIPYFEAIRNNICVTDTLIKYQNVGFPTDKFKRNYTENDIALYGKIFDSISIDSLVLLFHFGEISNLIEKHTSNTNSFLNEQYPLAHYCFKRGILLDRGCIGGNLIISHYPHISKKTRRKIRKLKK